MNSVSKEWFRVLGVEREDVLRLGDSLVAYATDHEPLLDEDESEEATSRLMLRADTLGDAGSLLCLVDQNRSISAFREAALLRVRANEPSLEYSLVSFDNSPLLGSLSDHILAPLAQGFSRVDDHYFYPNQYNEKQLSSIGSNITAANSVTGIPAWMIQRFAAEITVRTTGAADRSSELNLLRLIVNSADQTIRAAMGDNWHWRRLSSDIRVVEPELIAIGGLIAAVYGEEPESIFKMPATPAWISLIIGGQMRMRSRNMGLPG
ncbi:hypothetical protein [Nocardia pseudovaccinii]|uniref:hypothetical protein n=1 Tax=Nocardia pseudovaccinii TaxID=189540 RepID=UPI0012F4BD2D|nr:hypothetical protein [Nocardia pseudovaccinii]